MHRLTGDPEPAGDIGHRHPIVEDLQHRSIALLHQVQLHQHDSGLLRDCGHNTHIEEGDHHRNADPRVSGTYRGHCRPGTGAASRNCQPATEATVSTMNRVRTSNRPRRTEFGRMGREKDGEHRSTTVTYGQQRSPEHRT